MQNAGPQPFGKYVLQELVAVGGMAEIFRAKTIGADGFEKEVAIKRILPSYSEDDGFITMFKDEAKIAAQLDHANIVRIYDFDDYQGTYYIAMEYIDGRDLKQTVEVSQKHGKRLSLTQIIYIISETSKALHYAHTKTQNGVPMNIVHRDATPHNIMMSFSGDVKLMDFGIAKAASRATKTRAGVVKGKCAYMSPEQARGKQLDGRSDLFCLGIIFWELLTDRKLFAGGSDFDILSKVLKGDIPDPREYESAVPPEVSRIAMKALERDRDVRYADCGKLLQDLNSYFYSQCPDAHDHKLGETLACLFSYKGRSPQEVPDYWAGSGGGGGGVEEDVSGEATQLLDISQIDALMGVNEGDDASATMPLDVSQLPPGAFGGGGGAPPGPGSNPGGAPPSVGGYNPNMQQQGMQQQGMQGGYNPYNPYGGQQGGMPYNPSNPSMMYGGMMPPQQKSNTGLIIAIVFIFLLLIGGGVGVFLFMNQDKGGDEGDKGAKKEETTEAVAETAVINIKSSPSGAKITINGMPFDRETPVFGYDQAKVGDKLSLKFEKEGYEPKEVEQEIFMNPTDIDVTLDKKEESAEEKPMVTLVVDSDPAGGTIIINGEEKGKAPITVMELPVGEEVVIESKDISGYSDAEKKVTFEEAGDKFETITHDKKKSSRPKPEKKGPGRIIAKGIPWGQVTIDGKRLGNKPVSKEFEAGKHTIEIFYPPKKKKVSKTVKLKAGGKVTVTYDFNSDKWR